MTPEYTVLIVGYIFGFYMAWNIGANDVANSMASAVGAKAITIRQAVFIAGILNVLAGGGSLLTLPLLIFMGLPSAVANGTNRIAIFCQNVFAIRGFRKRGVMPMDLVLLCTPPALVGSWVGASLATAALEDAGVVPLVNDGRLLERAGYVDETSITEIYTVLVEGGDLDEPIADEVRGVLGALDGPCALEAAHAGDVGEKGARGHVRVSRRAFGQIAELGLRGETRLGVTRHRLGGFFAPERFEANVYDCVVIGEIPSALNNAASSSASGLGVVSSLEPTKIEFAPARKQSA